MDTLWTALTGLVLGTWLAASAVHQIPWERWSRVARFDVLRLLPQWHFFAPRPGRRDHHVVYRDLVGGRPGAWREMPVGEARPVIRWLWNPPRFRQKAQTDLINGLLRIRRLHADLDLPPGSERLSSPYLGLLSWVLAQPAGTDDRARQFAVLSSTGHEPGRALRVVYVSQPHRLTPGPRPRVEAARAG